jgi:quercetin dioxygenase-like cupin family protein
MVTPAELKWADAPSLPPGARVTLIEGQVDQPVPFTLRLQFPADYQLPAHWHPSTEHVTVLSGAINMGRGDTLDKAKTTALSTGSLVIVPPNTSRAAPDARRHASAGRVGSGAPVGGIETVTGVPVRCMNRIERLVGRAGRPSTGASHDRSAQRR